MLNDTTKASIGPSVAAAIAEEPGTEMLRMNEEARQLSQQLDCYLWFTVERDVVRCDVRVVGTDSRLELIDASEELVLTA